jgi:hypothetical protein
MRRKTLLVMTMVVALSMSMVGAAVASANMFDAFTQTELDENWITDRQFPSGGVESVSAYGRTDVAAIGVVGAEQFTPSNGSTFYYFEGIKKVGDFGSAVQVDLYVPAEWENAETSPANVGFWASDDPLTAYPLIVYRNSDTVDAGFYTFDVVYDANAEVWVGVYVPSGVDVNYDGWNTLSITLDTDADVANYAINGQEAGKPIYAAGDLIGQVYLNHYNDGVNDYTAYWHAGVTDIDSKDQCKDGDWEDAGFKNQGQCLRFVNTGKDSR